MLVIDLETEGLHRGAGVLGVGYKLDNQPTIYSKEVDPVALVKEQPETVVGHNLKYDLQVLGNPPVGQIFDTMVAEWLINPDQDKYGLKHLEKKYLNIDRLGYKELLQKYKPKKARLKDCNLTIVPQEEVEKYGKQDVETTFFLHGILNARLAEEGLNRLFNDVEMPFLKVLINMEMRGIKYDKSVLQQIEGDFLLRESGLRAEIWKMAGRELNIDSPKQLGNLLFEEMKIPVVKMSKKEGGPSTDDEVMKKLAENYPICAAIHEYRKITKLLRTYVHALPTYVHTDGRIHPSFRQTGTATGRISCDEPNLQNIPKSGEFGNEIRSAFVSDEGKVFIIADYDQMELRMMAHYSQDRVLLRAFADGVDIHKLTAGKIFGKSDITEEERAVGKTINFATIYGQTVTGLAKRLGISFDQARTFIYRYACQYPEAWTWRKTEVERVRQSGVTHTILKRKRKLLESDGFIDRLAINTPIQGSCADLVKVAMIRVEEALKGYETKMLLQVHDELIFEAPEGEVEEVLPIIQGCMESVNIIGNNVLKCPMKVEIKVGKNWGKADALHKTK